MPKSSNMELTGKTILITRAASQSADLRTRLENLSARVIECPTIQIVPPKTWKPVDDAIRKLSTYQWLLFTSANAVDQFMDRKAERPCHVPIAVVGSATADKVLEWGFKPTLVPKEFRAEGLLEAFPEKMVGTRILFPRAEVARELLPDELRRRGAGCGPSAGGGARGPSPRRAVRTRRASRCGRRRSGARRPPSAPRRGPASAGPAAATPQVSLKLPTFVPFQGTTPDFPGTPDGILDGLDRGDRVAVGDLHKHRTRQLLGLQPTITPQESTVPALVDAIRRHFTEVK